MGTTKTILVTLLALGATACGNGGDLREGSDGPEATHCAITWTTDAPASRFTVTMPIEAWAAGEHAYAGADAVLELTTGTWQITDGSFTLSMTEIATGASIVFTDESTHALSAGVFGDGNGRFFGTWQLEAPESAPSGAGTHFAVVDSICFDVGTTRSYATCF